MGDGVREVSHCGECPMHMGLRDEDGRQVEWCLLAALDARRNEEIPHATDGGAGRIWPDDPERPTWCPLERGPVTVRLREASRG